MTNKIKLTVEVEAPQWFLDLCAKAAKGHEAPAEEAPTPVKKPAAKAPLGTNVPPRAPSKKPAAKAPEPEEPEDGGFGGDAGAEDDKTVDDVKVAMQRLAKKDGKPAAMEFLSETYGVNNIAKLDQEQMNDLVAQVEAKLEE